MHRLPFEMVAQNLDKQIEQVPMLGEARGDSTMGAVFVATFNAQGLQQKDKRIDIERQCNDTNMFAIGFQEARAERDSIIPSELGFDWRFPARKVEGVGLGLEPWIHREMAVGKTNNNLKVKKTTCQLTSHRQGS